MSKRLTIAQLLEHIRSPLSAQSIEELLKDTYWKHDSDRYSSFKNSLPTRYYKFKEIRFLGSYTPSSQYSIAHQSQWRIVLRKAPEGGEMLLPIEQLSLLTLIEDKGEIGVVALMFL